MQMEDLKFSAVNVDAKELEKQKENLKKKNNDLQNTKKVTFDPKHYLNFGLKEDETTKTVKVRLLPISATDGSVFVDISTHALKVDREVAKSGFKSYLCLNDPKVGSEEECPICKRAQELFERGAQARKEGNETLAKSLFKCAVSLKKKKTFIARVIDREHEDEGVKFWRFNENSMGEGVYDKLMTLHKARMEEAAEEGEENYSIFDLYNGKDIIVTVTKTKIPDGFGGMKDKIAYNITDSGNRKPLTKDVEKGNAWLNDGKTWKDVYSYKTADYLDIVLEGKVPVYSKDDGKYVEKTVFDKETKKAEEEAATEILKEDYTHSSNNAVGNVDLANNGGNEENSDDELPF